MEKNTKIDNVNHPPHYTWLKEKCGIEVIDITRHMDFDLGNAIKYILRSGHKTELGLSNIEKQIEKKIQQLLVLVMKVLETESDDDDFLVLDEADRIRSLLTHEYVKSLGSEYRNAILKKIDYIVKLIR